MTDLDVRAGVRSDAGTTRPTVTTGSGSRAVGVHRWRSPLAEIGGVVVAAAGLAAVVVVAVRRRTDLYLPLDAAHYLAEAEQLAGRTDVLSFGHPPAFSALVVAADAVGSRYDAVLVAMAVSLAVFGAACYWLFRQWCRPGPSAVGALVAALLPIQAEILGWGGGANLVGLGLAVAAMAATEAWVRSHRAWGWVVGLLVGATFAAHPFALAVALFVCGGRVVVDIAGRRRVDLRSWAPNGVLGWISVAIASIPGVLVSWTYYTGVQEPGTVSLGAPTLRSLSDLLAWVGRENVAFLAAQVAALALPLFLRRRPPFAMTALISAVVLFVTVLVRADASYQSRVMYLLPVLVGAGVAIFGPVASKWFAAASGWSPSITGVVASVALVAVVAQLGFVARLKVALEYYGRIGLDDLPALESLEGSDGVVAASWFGQSYAEPTNWFANGVSRRVSWAPIGPWLSTFEEERQAGAALQRFFAGQVGLDNGTVQVAATGTASGSYALQIGIHARDFVFPVALLDQARTRLPFPIVSASARLDGQTIVLALGGGDGERAELRVTIDAATVTMEGSVDASDAGSWHLVFSPPPGLPWSTQLLGGGAARSRQFVSGVDLEATMTLTAAERPGISRAYGPGQPVDFDALQAQAVSWQWLSSSRGLPAPGPTTTFDEVSIAGSWDLTDIVVWRNTGISDRFEGPCYRRLAGSDDLVVFHMTKGCRTPSPSP